MATKAVPSWNGLRTHERLKYRLHTGNGLGNTPASFVSTTPSLFDIVSLFRTGTAGIRPPQSATSRHIRSRQRQTGLYLINRNHACMSIGLFNTTRILPTGEVRTVSRPHRRGLLRCPVSSVPPALHKRSSVFSPDEHREHLNLRSPWPRWPSTAVLDVVQRQWRGKFKVSISGLKAK